MGRLNPISAGKIPPLEREGKYQSVIWGEKGEKGKRKTGNFKTKRKKGKKGKRKRKRENKK